MATGSLMQCACGARAMVYLPKQWLAEVTGGSAAEVAEASAQDHTELTDGELDVLQGSARAFGVPLVDTRTVRQCPGCGADLLAGLQQSMVGLAPDRGADGVQP